MAQRCECKIRAGNCGGARAALVTRGDCAPGGWRGALGYTVCNGITYWPLVHAHFTAANLTTLVVSHNPPYKLTHTALWVLITVTSCFFFLYFELGGLPFIFQSRPDLCH